MVATWRWWLSSPTVSSLSTLSPYITNSGRGYGKDDAFKTAGFDLSVFVAREAGKEHRGTT